MSCNEINFFSGALLPRLAINIVYFHRNEQKLSSDSKLSAIADRVGVRTGEANEWIF